MTIGSVLLRGKSKSYLRSHFIGIRSHEKNSSHHLCAEKCPWEECIGGEVRDQRKRRRAEATKVNLKSSRFTDHVSPVKPRDAWRVIIDASLRISSSGSGGDSSPLLPMRCPWTARCCASCCPGSCNRGEGFTGDALPPVFSCSFVISVKWGKGRGGATVKASRVLFGFQVTLL